MSETLAAAGAIPAAQLRRARGLLNRWFQHEHAALTALNTIASLALLALALTMTYFGMRLAQTLGLVVTLNEAANAISPYAGAALLTLGVLRLVQNVFTRGTSGVSRFLGYIEVCVLLTTGLWAEAVAWYAGYVPDIFKPQLALSGGAVTADLLFFGTVIVPFFKPAMAAGLGALLTAKQIKTTAQTGNGRTQWYLALIGLLASACTLVIGMDVGQRHLLGAPHVHDIASDAKADMWAREFAPPFTAGTACRVSDMFGPRINPFYFIKPKPVTTAAADGATAPADAVAATPAPAVHSVARIENHPGVDIAARAGTPVHAMATGEIVFAGADPGFGNMVALKAVNSVSGETILLNGHMERLNVEPGQRVTRGDVIGWVGSTGISTGPHLHVQVCPGGHLHSGAFVCGQPRNPYEVWPTLYAITQLACAQGPVGF